MSNFKEIEEEFVFAVESQNIPEGTQAMQNLFDGLLAKHTELTFKELIDIRLYYNAKGTLKGLSDWGETV
jgi:hypothetical protein